MGQAVVIISGGIDLSAGTALSLFTCVLTTVMKKADPLSGVYALVAALRRGHGHRNRSTASGIGYLRIPPVIVTFATSFIWLGAALFLRPTPGGEAVDWFKWFYDVGAVPDVPASFKAFGAIIPPALILVLIGCAVLGHPVPGPGQGDTSTRWAATTTAPTRAASTQPACRCRPAWSNSIFILLAALFFVGQNQSGDARMGDPLTLRAIAAAVVGGIALTGGRGSVYFALVGALILSFVNKIIFFANIPYAYQTLVGGVIVIVAIASSQAYTLYNRQAIVSMTGRLS